MNRIFALKKRLYDAALAGVCLEEEEGVFFGRIGEVFVRGDGNELSLCDSETSVVYRKFDSFLNGDRANQN